MTTITDAAALAPHADRALRTGRPVTTGGLVLVPDELAGKASEHGLRLPDAPTLARQVGRTVQVFRAPTKGGQP